MSDVIKLELSKGLHIKCSRIGYKYEGLRLQIFDEIPFVFHVELQLSKSDCKQLIDLLKEHYEHEKERDWK